MSDTLLERIAVALEAIASATPNKAIATPGAQAAQAAQPNAGQSNSPSGITAQSLLELVQPLVQDEANKAKVKEVLVKYNLNRLGEAQESQYPALYAEFKAISPAAPAPATPSEDLI